MEEAWLVGGGFGVLVMDWERLGWIRDWGVLDRLGIGDASVDVNKGRALEGLGIGNTYFIYGLWRLMD